MDSSVTGEYREARERIERSKKDAQDDAVAMGMDAARDDSPPETVDIDVVVASVMRGDQGMREVSCHISCSGGKRDGMFSFHVERSAAAALINTRIRTEARVFVYTMWGVTPTPESRVTVFGGAS